MCVVIIDINLHGGTYRHTRLFLCFMINCCDNFPVFYIRVCCSKVKFIWNTFYMSYGKCSFNMRFTLTFMKEKKHLGSDEKYSQMFRIFLLHPQSPSMASFTLNSFVSQPIETVKFTITQEESRQSFVILSWYTTQTKFIPGDLKIKDTEEIKVSQTCQATFTWL